MGCSHFWDMREAAINLILTHFNKLSEKQQFCTLLYPTQAKIVKNVNIRIKQIFEARNNYNPDYHNNNDVLPT